MYIPSHFEETRPAVLRELMSQHPLGALVVVGGGELIANHMPFEHDVDPQPHGTLRGHVARANPVWRDCSPDIDALAIFQGPSAYVSPNWYSSKQVTGKVVPTWNYAVVHAYGPVRFVHDAQWLRALVERLTARHERSQPKPWKVSDAPPSFIETQLKAIVGIEIQVTKLIGKWKNSQNRSASDRAGVVAGLRGNSDSDSRTLADFIAEVDAHCCDSVEVGNTRVRRNGR